MVRLKELRIERGFSQQALADSIGISQQRINGYENDEYQPDIDTLKNMATFFDTSIDYLVGLVDIRTPITKVKKYELNEIESELLDSFRAYPAHLQNSLKIVFSQISEFADNGGEER